MVGARTTIPSSETHRAQTASRWTAFSTTVPLQLAMLALAVQCPALTQLVAADERGNPRRMKFAYDMTEEDITLQEVCARAPL